jgi:superfamily II RNA helicase
METKSPDYPLYRRLPKGDDTSNGKIFDRFLEYIAERGLDLYAAQEEAILELFDEKNVILNTPTGSGKSLVATALHFKALAQGRRSVYTCPIKALVNEKFLGLCRDFGPDQVGMSTGDATVNRDAPILCCTAEILANIALREGPLAPVDDVIMDEFHYYADRERGVAWQVPLLTLPQTRFLLMSATLGDTTFFEEELTQLNGKPTSSVFSSHRPVPLECEYSEQPMERTLEELVATGKAPVYIVHFTQMDAAQSAQSFTSLNFCSREEKEAISKALEGVQFTSPYGPDIKRWLKHGIGLHHAGLLPKYRVLVEQLAQNGLLKIICGTDTLGVGINVPIKTVLFTRLCKYDGQKTGILSARDFHQISGRAGRKGFDNKGWVVVQAPEHVIENLQLEQKAGGDSKKLRKIVKRKPPEKGFVAWDKNTFTRLLSAQPERLTSRFQVMHGMLLNVLSRPGDSCGAMRSIIKRCHDSPNAKIAHGRRAWQLFRSLTDRKIIEFIPKTADGSYLRVNVALQDDFSLDQTLSLYLIDTLKLIDPETPDYALDLLTVVESILEDPDIILRRQLDRVKDRKMAEMKMEGIEYDKRMEELEKLEYPKPLREFIYSTFNQFSAQHPWVGQENIRPKSIAREMYENFRSFADYIKDYELQRVEGILLRHLSSVYKTLSQTVPDEAKTEPVREMELYLATLIRQVDSSLLDEWEKMRNPNYVSDRAALAAEQALVAKDELRPSITRDTKNFTRLIRNVVFNFVRGLSNGDFDVALGFLEPSVNELGEPYTPEMLKVAMESYYLEHQYICLDPNARNNRHTFVAPSEDKKSWRVRQMLVDPEEHNDWELDFTVDLKDSETADKPLLRLRRFGAVATG